MRLLGAEQTSRHRDHQKALWNSILHAKGFQPSFRTWWAQQDHGFGVVESVPAHPPVIGDAVSLRDGLLVVLARFEAVLNQSRKHANRLQQATTLVDLYRTVRKPAAPQVDSLHNSCSAVVTSICEQDLAVTFDKSDDWPDDQAPFAFPCGTKSPFMVTPDTVWLDSIKGIEVGDVAHQVTRLGSLPALFDAFESYWADFWCKHDGIPPSQWADVLSFAKEVLRPVQSAPCEVTRATFRATVLGKSVHAATGLDGVSRSDLLNLCDSEVDSMLSMFARGAHLTGEWPQQCLNGAVKSLAKVDDPVHVGSYRPVTIFALPYRTWGSIQSRFWIQQLDLVLDPFVSGNRPHASAAEVWYYVLRQVELGHDLTEERTGLVLDLTKAFNTIPRLVSIAACRLLGLDAGVLRAWAGALGSMKRHFVVRDSYSAGLFSSRGVPEGCGMSILAMMGVASLFHAWLQRSLVSPTVMSFVDNWEVLVSSADEACKALDEVMKFASLLDLSVDLSKTFFWSTSASTRQILRQRRKVVRLSTKDLGAHMIYGKQLTNGDQLQRIADLDPFWERLQRAKGHHKDKVTVVVTAAWPKAFHACSAVVIGRKHFVRLRTMVMRALNLEKPHANSWLQCALDHPLLDPAFFVAVSSLRDLRSLAEVEETRVALTCAMDPVFGAGFGSISTVAVSRVQSLGFHLGDHGWALDSLGRFDLLTCAYSELLQRAQLAWVQIVAQAVSHRSCFAGLQTADFATTRQLLQLFSLPERGLLWRVLNGSALCNDMAFHWSDDGAGECVFCKAEDTLEHRLWTCPVTARFRQLLPDDFASQQPSLPAAFSVQGWVCQYEHLQPWFRALLSIPTEAFGFCPLPEGGILDLFTDGSCWWPAEPLFRVASWSVVVMAPLSEAPSFLDAKVLLAEPLPGLRQTPGRAEVMALLQALKAVLQSRCWARIWTDSATAWRRFQKYVVAQEPIKATAADADLWGEICSLVAQIGHHKVQVVKVPAHEPAHTDLSAFDQWVRIGNGVADTAASSANRHRSGEFWALWEQQMRQVLQRRWHGWLMLRHICDCLDVWLRHHHENQGASAEPEPKRKGTRIIPDLRWSNPHDFELQKPTFVRYFNPSFASTVAEWLRSIFDAEAPLAWVSFWQFYVSFCWFGDSLVHPVKVEGKWALAEGTSAEVINHWSIQTRVKWFRLMLQQFFKDAEVDYVTATTKPCGIWIQCFRGCVAFRMRASSLHLVDEWLGRHLPAPANGQGMALNKLPNPWG